ncbi:MAG: phosphoribosyltransferase family protein [Dehalococcoidia bacterium]
MKISSENIKSKVTELSEDISTYFKTINADELCVVVPMNGGVPFSVDLLREISNPERIFISYVLDQDGKWFFSGSKPTKNSNILIVEDIYDTGETLKELVDYLNKIYEPKDLKTVVMLDKKLKKRAL